MSKNQGEKFFLKQLTQHRVEKLAFFLSVLLALISSDLLAFEQNHIIAQYKVIGVNDDLSHREVYSIGFDEERQIWLGTRAGLDRYDGNRFEHFDFPPDFDCRNDIRDIFYTPDGFLYLVTYVQALNKKGVKCINFFDLSQNSFLKWEQFFESSPPPFDENEIFQILPYTASGFLFTLNSGAIFSYTNGVFKQLHFANESRYLSIERVFQNRFLIWLNNGKGSYDLGLADSTGQIKTLKEDLKLEEKENLLSVANEKGFYLFEKKQGQLYLSQLLADGSLTPLGQKDSLSLPIDFEIWNQHKTLLYNKKDQQLCLLVGKQLYLIEISEKDFDVKVKLSPPNEAYEYHYTTMDQLGNFWAGTNNGLLLGKFKKSPFHIYFHNPNITEDLQFNSVRGILTQNEKLYFNSYKGQFIAHLNKQITSNIHSDDSLLSKEVYYPIIEGNGGSLIYGGLDIRIKHMGIEKEEIYTWEEGIEPQTSWSLIRDRKQRLWIGLENGLAYLERGDSIIRNYPISNRYVDLAKSVVYHFLKLNRDELLLATSKGIFHLHIEKGIIARYHKNGFGPAALPFNAYHHIHQSPDSTFWLSSMGGGLIHWDPVGGSSTQYTKRDGLADNQVYAVYEDQRGFLWISTDYGLSRFNKQSKRFINYLEADGISHHEFNRIAHYQGADGSLFFGSLNGITMFRPLQILPDEEEKYPLILTKFQILTESQRLEDYTQFLKKEKAWTLGTGVQFLQIDFALLDYFRSGEAKYFYRIEGIQDDWVSTNDHSLVLSGLPAGNFKLQIKGQDANGYFSSNHIEIPLMVLKPWYQRTWFWLLGFSSFLALITGLYFYRLFNLAKTRNTLSALVAARTKELSADKQIIEEQANELKKLNYLKSKFFVNIAHELRTPLTLLLGPVSSVLKSNELSNRNFTLLAMAKQNLEKILKLIEEILDLGKLEAGKLQIHYSSFSLKAFLSHLLLNFEQLGKEKHITLQASFNFDESLHVATDKEKLDKILSNFLTNAFRFTPKGGLIEFKVLFQDAKLKVEISDNGPGIPKEDLPYIFDRYYQATGNQSTTEGGTGIGLAICKEYTELMGGIVNGFNNKSGGATFLVQLPLREANIEEGGRPPSDSIAQKPLGDQQLHQEAVKPDMTVAKASSTVPSRVLVVEDNTDLREYLSLILGEQGYQIHILENGKQALEYLSNLAPEHLPQLILTDMMMPIMDGEAFIKAIKGISTLRLIPVIVLTAKVQREEKLDILRIGVDDYLTKPFSIEELIIRINNLIQNYQNRLIAIKELIPEPVQQLASEKINNLENYHEETRWLKEVYTSIESQLSSFDFSVEKLAKLMGISRRHLYRRIKLSSGMPPHELIQEIRYQRARQLLENKALGSVKAVAYEVGIKDVVNFSKNYKKRFAKLPSAYF